MAAEVRRKTETVAAKAVEVNVPGGSITIRARERVEPLVQVKTNIPPALLRRLRAFAFKHELTLQAVLRAAIEAVVGSGAAEGG